MPEAASVDSTASMPRNEIAFPPAARAQDAELIAQAARLRANIAECDALTAPYDDEPGWPAHLDPAISALAAEYHALAESMGAIPAQTLPGLRVKAEAALERFSLNANRELDPWEDGFLAWSTIRDLLRLLPGERAA